MSSNSNHPDIELFDRMRAGLLDDNARLKADLRQHLETCPRCRQQTDWAAVTARLDVEPGAQLTDARRHALEAAGKIRRRRFTLPVAVAASLALVFVLASNIIPWQAEEQTGQPAQALVETPDLYENLDFYLWLADHQPASGQSRGFNDQRS